MKKVMVLCFAVVALGVTILPAKGAAGFTVTGTGASEYIFGSYNNDKLVSGGGVDALVGGPGKDTLVGTNGTGLSSLLLGGPGKDTFKGGVGDEVLVDDDGTPGDEMFGGSGYDTVYAADGAADLINCGSGDDTAFADKEDTVKACENVVRFNMSSFNFGTNGIDGMTSNEGITFGKRNDDSITSFFASTTIETVLPGAGNDSVNTQDGGDIIFDEDGSTDALLDASDGDDYIFTGDGGFESAIECGGGNDTLVTFSGEDDTIASNCETIRAGFAQVVAV